ncbi:hypothetical protein PENSPDRAFT_679752 [Peniophora sp. CONT]|nr:hypothetical protein PENSPDRAFT_679752 [Peniophora sp. CONT]
MTRAHPLRYSGTEIAVAPAPRSSPGIMSESKLNREVASAWTAIANGRLAAVGGLHGCRAPTQDNEGARALVERELHGALAMVVALRRRQNAFTLAATLPSELLALIFLSLASMRRLSRTSTFQASWISVTHVCASWRSAALTYARLWTDLPLDVGQLWAAEFVTRSKSLPIQVLAYLPASLLLKQSRFAVLAETSTRIATLSLKGSAPHIQIALELLKFCSFDGLQSLALEPASYIDSNALPIILKRAERLETLSLSRTSIAWTSIHWEKLRSFSCLDLPRKVSSNETISLISA